MPENEVILQPLHDAAVEATFRSPSSVIKEAEMVAKAFGPKANALQLYKKIGESKHLQIEGWQLLASMYRVTSGCTTTNFVNYGDAQGFEATAEAIHVPTGRILSTATGMCLNDEDKWGPVTKYDYLPDPDNPGKTKKTAVGFQNKPLQQLRSMAQTRACSKVLSNLFKVQAKMAGFETTPGEEMMGYEYDQRSSGSAEPQRKSATATAGTPAGPSSAGSAHPGNNGNPEGSGRIITEPQKKRLWGIAMGSGKSKEETIAIIKSFGFNRGDDVTTEKYEAVCAALQKGDAQE